METLVKLSDVNVSYLQNRDGTISIKDLILKASLIKSFVKFPVLYNINFEIIKGESVGILGPNGCGKSTLLRTIAGIITPDSGKVEVNCRVSPLLSLGVGIEHELTGLENIKVSLALSGNYTRASRKELLAKVIDFSELTKKQLKMPAKMYSSGMLARLAFSSVLSGQPELLMIDEILAVGDQGFQFKCIRRINELMSNGTTLVFISHNPNEITEICKRGICMKDGQIIYDGNTSDAAKMYVNLFS